VITISVHPADVEAGAAATASIRLEDEPAGIARVTVEVGWRTEGRGDPDSAVVQSTEMVTDGTAPPGMRDVSVDFTVPADGPVSYDGKILRIIWEVRVRVAAGGEERTQVESFRVTPRRVTA
jgi:hypothetical protein